MQNQLFDSLVSIREESSQKGTHMGLGLHIVALVARFHGGQASAQNRPDKLGVSFTVSLPQGASPGIQTLGPADG
jgi:signal transduction histidine kinase